MNNPFSKLSGDPLAGFFHTKKPRSGERGGVHVTFEAGSAPEDEQAHHGVVETPHHRLNERSDADLRSSQQNRDARKRRQKPEQRRLSRRITPDLEEGQRQRELNHENANEDARERITGDDPQTNARKADGEKSLLMRLPGHGVGGAEGGSHDDPGCRRPDDDLSVHRSLGEHPRQDQEVEEEKDDPGGSCRANSAADDAADVRNRDDAEDETREDVGERTHECLRWLGE